MRRPDLIPRDLGLQLLEAVEELATGLQRVLIEAEHGGRIPQATIDELRPNVEQIADAIPLLREVLMGESRSRHAH